MVKTTRREAIIEFLSYKIPFLDAIASQITLFPGEFYCQKAMRRKEKRDGLLRTTEEFAGRTSIHGVSYAFDKDLGLLDRLLWLLLLIAFLTLAGFLTYKSWLQWGEEQVICHQRNSDSTFVASKGGDNSEDLVVPD